MIHPLNTQDELLDLVNENDEVIEQCYKGIVYQEKKNNFRVINAFLINNKNEVWIPTRSADKKLFPSCLDASVGGHVAAGEDYITACKRETMEELNMNIDDHVYKFLTKLTPHQDKVSAFMHVYAIYTNEIPAYNRNDFSSASWMTINDVKEMIQNGVATKGDLPILINILGKFIS